MAVGVDEHLELISDYCFKKLTKERERRPEGNGLVGILHKAKYEPKTLSINYYLKFLQPHQNFDN